MFARSLAALVLAGCARPAPPVGYPDERPFSSRACVEVRAACEAPGHFVARARAAGLEGLDGGRVRFALRHSGAYVNGGPFGLVTAQAVVERGAFEACVCAPAQWRWYPALAAVVFAPNRRGELAPDVARAAYLHTYAARGTEDLSLAMREAPRPALAEEALAALEPRRAAVTVRGVDHAHEGRLAFAALVADERPVSAEVRLLRIAHDAMEFTWEMPGRSWPSERLAVVIDRNENRRCDPEDLGAIARLDGRTELSSSELTWLDRDRIAPVCAAVAYDQHDH